MYDFIDEYHNASVSKHLSGDKKGGRYILLPGNSISHAR